MQLLGAPEGGGSLYELALTHRSYAYEQPEPVAHNERLEFLGDAILEAIVTDLIYRTYPELSEGELARLRASVVNSASLAELAKTIGLGSEIRLGRGEEASGGREKASLLADTFEAVIGAVYLDQGIEVVRSALEKLMGPRLAASRSSSERYDAKTALQEIAVRETGSPPVYRVSSSGPDHQKSFVAEVALDGRTMGSGEGRSKKEAEYNAARRALEQLGPEERDERGGPSARAS